jgi:hypothetical protein
MPDIRNLFFALLLSAGIMLGVSYFVFSLHNSYVGTITDENYTVGGYSYVSQVNQTISEMQDIKNESTHQSQGPIIDAFSAAFNTAAWVSNAVQMVFGIINIYDTLITEILVNLHIGTYNFGLVKMIINGMIVGIIIFELISMIQKYKT